jgi:hypothetical protein
VVTYRHGALHVLNDFIEVAEITLAKPPRGTSFVATPDGEGGTKIGLAPSKGHVLQDLLAKFEYKVSQSFPAHAAEVLKGVVEKLAGRFADTPPGHHFKATPDPDEALRARR